MHRVNPLLQQAYQALQAGQIQSANQLVEQAYKIAPKNPDVLHLMALCSKAAGDVKSSEKWFKQCLSINAGQVQVFSNFGNFLMGIGRLDDAVIQYRKAIIIKPDYVDAILNLCLCYSRLGAFDDAVKTAQDAIKIIPNDARLHTILGSNFKDLNRIDEAIESYNKALSIEPNYFFALHNKGVALRIKSQPKEALKCYDKILEQGQNISELHFNRGCAFYDIGELDKAEEELHVAIKLKPDAIEAHESLNKLYWEHGKDDKFAESYENAIKLIPQSPFLRSSYSSQLMLAGKETEAENVIKKALADLGENHIFLHDLGAIHARRGDYEKAKEFNHKALMEMPEVARYRIDMANYLIREQDFKGALEHLDVAEKSKPYDQEMWAYKGICWRLSGDEKEQWLNDYDNFVQGNFLNVPDGYDNLEHFLNILKKELHSMHTTGRHPLDQSLRNGTQTTSFLLDQPAKVIQDYRKVLSQCVTDYLSSLPDDPTHPFLNRHSKGFTFSGSWSVRLKDEGFHVNHIHPKGWLSGPTYIEIPPEMSPDDPDKAGWVKFGETCLGLGDDEHVAKAVCPEPGLVVFFPSYMWHGTNPFKSDEYRMTTPCDIMPLK